MKKVKPPVLSLRRQSSVNSVPKMLAKPPPMASSRVPQSRSNTHTVRRRIITNAPTINVVITDVVIKEAISGVITVGVGIVISGIIINGAIPTSGIIIMAGIITTSGTNGGIIITMAGIIITTGLARRRRPQRIVGNRVPRMHGRLLHHGTRQVGASPLRGVRASRRGIVPISPSS